MVVSRSNASLRRLRTPGFGQGFYLYLAVVIMIRVVITVMVAAYHDRRKMMTCISVMVPASEVH
jgi:hypothetical protein